MAERAATQVLGDLLVARGASRSFGSWSVQGLDHVPCDDSDVACLLADMDGRVNGGVGVACLADQVVHISNVAGGRSPVHRVGGADEIAARLAELPDPGPLTVAFAIDDDLDTPWPEPTLSPRPSVVPARLDVSLAQLAVGVLIGPWVGSHASASIRRLADATGAWVFNTWGAKGVLRWDDAAHGGTIGLQTRDGELAGLSEVDLLLTVGLDPDETALVSDVVEGRTSTLVQPLAAAALEVAVDGWPSQCTPIGASPFFDAVSSVVRPRYERDGRPLDAARAALQLAGARPDGGVVVGDADRAGFWLARTYPTGDLGAVVVASSPVPDAAVAGALAANVAGRRAIAVRSARPSAVAGAERSLRQPLVEWAERHGFGIREQVWHDHESVDGPDVAIDADEHARVCVEASDPAPAGVTTAHLRVDMSLDDLVAVAGEPVAWARQ